MPDGLENVRAWRKREDAPCGRVEHAHHGVGMHQHEAIAVREVVGLSLAGEEVGRVGHGGVYEGGGGAGLALPVPLVQAGDDHLFGPRSCTAVIAAVSDHRRDEHGHVLETEVRAVEGIVVADGVTPCLANTHEP